MWVGLLKSNCVEQSDHSFFLSENSLDHRGWGFSRLPWDSQADTHGHILLIWVVPVCPFYILLLSCQQILRWNLMVCNAQVPRGASKRDWTGFSYFPVSGSGLFCGTASAAISHFMSIQTPDVGATVLASWIQTLGPIFLRKTLVYGPFSLRYLCVVCQKWEDVGCLFRWKGHII